MVNAPGVLGDASATIAAFGGSVLDIGSQIAIMAVAMPDKFKVMAMSAVESFGTMIGAAIKYVATSIAGAVTSAAAWVAANIAMIAATGGILLAIGAAIAIVVLLIKHWDWVKEKASEVWEWIKSAWDGIKDAVVGAVQSVLDWVGANWPTILAIIGGPIGLAVKFVIDHWEQIKAAFSDGVNAVIGFVGWLGRLPGMVWSYLSSMVGVVGAKINEIVAWFQGLGNRTIAAIGNLGGRMAEVGRGIVTGIWNGIQSGWGWLQNQVANLARSLLSTAKRALGIGSPSRAFRLEVGEAVPAGVAQGIEGAMQVALRSVRTMGAQLVNAATQDFGQGVRSSGVALPTTSVGRVGLTANPAPVTITLKVDSSGSRVDDLLVGLLQNYIRVQGGDVQVVLGT
jgi:phage-related protein